MKQSALACFAFMAITAASAGDIQIRQMSSNSYELTVVSRNLDMASVQASLMPTAKKLCGNLNVSIGRYSFDEQKPVPGNPGVATLTLHQTIKCTDAELPVVVTAAPAPPFVKDDALIETLSLAYLAHKDAGRYEEAFATFAPAMKASTTLASWSAGARRFNAFSGPLKARRIKRVTWYDNPPSAPAPGVYVAADYAADYATVPISCGYVVWHLQPDGAWRVIREEFNHIDAATAEKMSPDQLTQLKRRFRC